jgi:hypothetical protein
MVLASKSRNAVNVVLMKKYADTDLSQFTEEFSCSIFAASDAVQELKTKAASILVHVLQWGGDHGYCERPTFDHTIGSAKEPVKRGSAAKPYAQISIDTLEVVKVWPSMKEAMNVLGVCNLDRCARQLRTSGGYYWSLAADADTFRERLEEKRRNKASKFMHHEPEEEANAPVPVSDGSAVESEDQAPKDEDGIAVGEVDTTQHTETPSSLLSFTDKQLIDELARRGWKIQPALNIGI